MKLGLRFLNDVGNVNSFEHSTNLEFFAGDTQTIYFQLIDVSVDRPEQGFNPPGRRYVPETGATLQVRLSNIDDAKKVARVATQPFPGDPSIWSIPILVTDVLKGTVRLSLILTEGLKVLHSANIPGVFLRVE